MKVQEYCISQTIKKDLMLHDATTQHLRPLFIEPHLQLPGGMCEGKVGIHPLHLYTCLAC